ncbi:MAG: dipeptidase PepE [bacterium]|nr:dipeptidase PepE [bacterium]
MRLLLLSNSTNPGEPYLNWPRPYIKDFLGKNTGKVLFVPFAGVTFTWEVYEERVSAVFAELGYEVESIHRIKDKKAAVENAGAIAVGGGNTWRLLHTLYRDDLVDIIREKVTGGLPYIGWSAGSNVACPTIKTTNDMPIIEPPSFKAFNLVPFQLNPHYLDANPENHGGETREQRLLEFIEINPGVHVCGLREGCAFRIEGGDISMIGNKPMRLFKKGSIPREYEAGSDFKFLLD